jgi:uncharacterized protein (DUF305 family)
MQHHQNHYARLGVMSLLSFVAMYALMYAMVDSTGSVYNNLNQAMIPHHSSAILMCQEASIRDARIRDLRGSIIAGQQAEIEAMKRLLRD